MLELGDQSLNLHRQVGEKAAALGLDGLVVVAADPEASAVMEGAAGSASWFVSPPLKRPLDP